MSTINKAIYAITNNVNGKKYIGQTVNPYKRWWQHKNNAKKHLDDYPIHLALQKYGEDNFTFEIIEWTTDYDNREKELINELNTISPNGYNVSSGGSNNIMYGENHPRNTLTEDTISNIISDLKNGNISDRDIAKKYNTTDKIVADINHGYSHRQENETYPIRIKKGLQKLTDIQVKEIIDVLINTNIGYQKIADNYGVSKGAIYHINKGLTFFDEKNNYPLRTCN